MLDLGDIRRTHNDDSQIIGDAFLPRNKAILKLRQAHRQRGLLLDEVEWLQREYNKEKARADLLGTALEQTKDERDKALSRIKLLESLDEMAKAALKL